MDEFLKIEPYKLVLLSAGIIALLAATIPVIMERKVVTPPIIYLLLGIGGYYLFTTQDIDPLDYMELVKRLTEFVVIVALTNAGLKIRNVFAWATWKYSVRLLLIAMPVTIVAAAYLGWWILGLAPASAMLLGALISPTDPVLAAQLQTSRPSKEDTSTIKLGLTSEAGLNDGLAFPFTYFAILAVTEGLNYNEWIGHWFLYHFLYKIAAGVAIGLLSGWVLSKVVFSIGNKDQLSKISRGILCLSLTLLPYAITEIAMGYGFIAVFVAAAMFSRYEEHDKHMDSLHDFNEELESLMVAFLFIFTGIFIAANFDKLFDWKTVVVALTLLLVIRPLAGYLSLMNTKLIPFQKFVMSFYGIRGIGSVYYLAYAFTAAKFDNADDLIGVLMITIFFSVLIHGLSAKKIQERIQRHNPQEKAQQENDE